MITREQPQGWIIKSTRFCRPNVVSCEVITDKWNLLIEAYLSPYTLDHLPYLAEALAHFQYQEPIVLGDLNANVQSWNLIRLLSC